MNYDPAYTDPLLLAVTVWLVGLAIMGLFANYHRR